MKNAYYFPHFSNARTDKKLKRVIKDHGIAGYGIYFMLLEVLREQTDFKYTLKDLDLLADEFNISQDILKKIINDYELFQANEIEFYSVKLIEYLQPYLEKTLKARESANKRWAAAKDSCERNANAMPTHKKRNANAIPTQCESNANAMQIKENKKNKRKEIKEIKEEIIYKTVKNISMTKEEFDKLIERNYTKKQIDDILDQIEIYPKEYTNLYATALNWLKRNEEKKEAAQQEEIKKASIIPRPIDYVPKTKEVFLNYTNRYCRFTGFWLSKEFNYWLQENNETIDSLGLRDLYEETKHNSPEVIKMVN